MDENTRRQTTWIIVAAAALSLVILAGGRRGELGRLRNQLEIGSPAQRVAAVERLVETQKLADAVANQPRWVQDNAVNAVALIGTPKAIFQLMTCWTVVDSPVQPRIQATVARFGALAIPPLVEALTDKDAKIRAGAPGVLTAIGESTIPYLLPLMGAWDDYIRTGVATVFGGVGKPVCPDLVKILERGEPLPNQDAAQFNRERDCATTSLLNMKLVAMDALTKDLLVYKDPEVRGQAATMIGTIGAGLAKPEEQIQTITPLLKPAGTDSAWAVRRKATAALGAIGAASLDSGVVAPVLMGRLKDDRVEVRQAAVESLGKIGAIQAAPVLASMLIANQSGASRELSVALVRLGEPSLAPLQPALKSGDAAVRLLAVQTVSEVGGPGSIGYLAAALRDPVSAEVREVASDALRNAPPESLAGAAASVIPALAAALNDPQWQVYYAARDALAKIGAPAVPSLIQALASGDTRVGHMAEMALTRIGSPAVNGLVAALLSGNPRVVNWASISLGEISEPAVPALSNVIGNGGAPALARGAAARALGATGMIGALEPLKKAAKAAEPPVRVAALQGLVKLGNEGGTEDLVGGLTDADRGVRDTAMGLLKNWRQKPVQDLLKKVVEGSDVDAKRRAAVALVYQNAGVTNQLLRQVSTPATADEVAQQAAWETPLAEAAVDAAAPANVRRDAITALGYIGSEKTIDALKSLLQPSNTMAIPAARSIAMIGVRVTASMKEGTVNKLGQAGTMLITLVKQPPTPELGIAAAAALADMEDIPVKDLIKELAGTAADGNSREWAAAILAVIGKPATEEVLRVRGSSKDLTQRQWLASTLQIIGDAMALQLMKHLPAEEKPQEAQVKAIEAKVEQIRAAQAI